MITKFETLKLLEKNSYNIFSFNTKSIDDLFNYINDNYEINFLDSVGNSIFQHSLIKYHLDEKILDLLNLLLKKKFNFNMDKPDLFFHIFNTYNTFPSISLELFLFFINNVDINRYHLWNLYIAMCLYINHYHTNNISKKDNLEIIISRLLEKLNGLSQENKKYLYMYLNKVYTDDEKNVAFNIIEIIYDIDKRLLNGVLSKITNNSLIKMIEKSKMSNFYKKQIEINKFKI